MPLIVNLKNKSCGAYSWCMQLVRMASNSRGSNSSMETIGLSSIEEAIVEVLPNLGATKLSKLVEILVDPARVGVTGVGDLPFVDEDDIKDHLSRIEVRKLLHHWKKPATSEIENESSADGSPGSQSDLNLSSVGDPEEEIHVPWFKMPPQLMSALKKEERPSPRLRKEMIRIVVDGILKPGNLQPRKRVLRLYAREIVAAYPESFRDEVDGEQVGTGFDSILSQLVNRVDNLGRDTQHNFLKRQLSPDETDQHTKKKISDYYGCVNWQPSTLPKGETEKTQSEKREMMKEVYESNNSDGGAQVDVAEMMRCTYASQRRDINNTKFVLETCMENWPYLFRRSHLLDHAKELLGKDLMEKVEESAGTKFKTIHSFMLQEARIQGEGMIADSVRLIDCAIKKRGDKMPLAIGTMMLLCNFAKEEFSQVVKSVKMTTDCDSLELPGTPCIIAIGEPLETDKFRISIGKTVTTKVENPLAALAVWFSMFFVFNLEYPSEANVLCEFMQRCVFGINPPAGTKSAKKTGKKASINSTVLKLTNQLKDFQFRQMWET